MKTNHTPKPWIIDNTMAKDKRINTFWYRIRDDSGNVIAEVKGQHCGINNSTAEANAKLIVTSPILLKELSNLIEACLRKVKTSDIRKELLNAQRAVSIAKGNVQ